MLAAVKSGLLGAGTRPTPPPGRRRLQRRAVSRRTPPLRERPPTRGAMPAVGPRLLRSPSVCPLASHCANNQSAGRREAGTPRAGTTRDPADTRAVDLPPTGGGVLPGEVRTPRAAGRTAGPEAGPGSPRAPADTGRERRHRHGRPKTPAWHHRPQTGATRRGLTMPGGHPK